jgi:hypothetical protein
MMPNSFLAYYPLLRNAVLATIFLVAGSVSTGVAKEGPILIEDDVPIERGFARETVVSGLEHPWGMVWLPDGDLLVTERPGRLRLVEISADGSGRLNPTPVAGLPPVFARGQGGTYGLFNESSSISILLREDMNTTNKGAHYELKTSQTPRTVQLERPRT